MKYAISFSDANYFVKKIYWLITLPELDVNFSAKWARTLTRLIEYDFLKKQRNVVLNFCLFCSFFCSKFGNELKGTVVLDWKPLYDSIRRLQFGENTEGGFNGKYFEG